MFSQGRHKGNSFPEAGAELIVKLTSLSPKFAASKLQFDGGEETGHD